MLIEPYPFAKKRDLARFIVDKVWSALSAYGKLAGWSPRLPEGRPFVRLVGMPVGGLRLGHIMRLRNVLSLALSVPVGLPVLTPAPSARALRRTEIWWWGAQSRLPTP